VEDLPAGLNPARAERGRKAVESASGQPRCSGTRFRTGPAACSTTWRPRYGRNH